MFDITDHLTTRFFKQTMKHNFAQLCTCSTVPKHTNLDNVLNLVKTLLRLSFLPWIDKTVTFFMSLEQVIHTQQHMLDTYTHRHVGTDTNLLNKLTNTDKVNAVGKSRYTQYPEYVPGHFKNLINSSLVHNILILQT